MKRHSSEEAPPVPRRGEIWWVDLPPPEGSEPGYRHPFLVLQHDAFNRSAIRTIVGVMLTSNTGLAELPGNILLSPDASGLPRESVVNVSQIVTIDRRLHLVEYAGSIDQETLREVEKGVRLVLAL